MVMRVWPSTTVSVSLTAMEFTVPAQGATTGFSILRASMIANGAGARSDDRVFHLESFDDSHFLVGGNSVADLDLQFEHGASERALDFGTTGNSRSGGRSSGSDRSGSRSGGNGGIGIKNFYFDIVGLAFETDTDGFLHFDISWLKSLLSFKSLPYLTIVQAGELMFL